MHALARFIHILLELDLVTRFSYFFLLYLHVVPAYLISPCWLFFFVTYARCRSSFCHRRLPVVAVFLALLDIIT
jgi:hypothetical protein